VAESYKSGIWHGFIIKEMIKRFYGLSDGFIAQSEAMKLDMIKYLGVEENRIKVINNPVNNKIEGFVKFNEVIKSNSGKYILCVGRLEHQKAFDVAIKVFAEVVKFFPDITLKIVGEGSMHHQLLNYVESLDLCENVVFEGYQENMIPFYVDAEATLLTSIYEGFPNSLVESICLGTPVVSFDCPSGPGEIIIDGENGYLVENGDVQAMARSLKHLINNPIDSSKVIATSYKYYSSEIVSQYERELE
jgi:glycosyltransferase involved in cell wall biosynthesis